MINIPKGTKDMLPKEAYKWHYVENVCKQIADCYNLKEIRTPVFEHTELFLRGVGDTTDVVNKEMYTFFDKGDRSITLKPEGTAGVARSFIENGMHNDALPVKMFYFTPVFRYERPQAGRLREHHQFGIEMFGARGADMDAEVIVIASTILKRLGLSAALRINSMGCKTCRAEYNAALKQYLGGSLDGLCETCRSRFDKNPLRILDCKEEACRKITSGAPKITDYLCSDCREHFERVQSLLTAVGISFTVDPHIVRGLDYYTKTVFEFVTTALGAQGTICGGGGYDGLIAQLGGNDMCGVGFGMGIERVLMLMEAENAPFDAEKPVKLYIANLDAQSGVKAFELACQLRSNGVKVEIDHGGRSLKAQMKYADKLGAEYVIVLGDDELTQNSADVKCMNDGEKTRVDFASLSEYFSK